jgi:hypothetical protein
MTDERLAGGIKTSGERRTFETGAHRDSNTKVLKGRMDLVPAVAVRRFALHCTKIVDGPNRLKKAELQNKHVSYFYNMAMGSLYLWMEGERPECDGGAYLFDHLANALWHTQQIMHLLEGEEIWMPATSSNWSGERYDMISPLFLRRTSIHYQKGGINYGDRNWEKGMPAMVTWDCATRHLTNWLEKEDTEDHLAAVGWNVCSTMHTIEMCRRGLLPETLVETIPMYRNIQRGTPK